MKQCVPQTRKVTETVIILVRDEVIRCQISKYYLER